MRTSKSYRSSESASMNSELMPFVTTLGCGFLDGFWGHAIKPALSTYTSRISFSIDRTKVQTFSIQEGWTRHYFLTLFQSATIV